MFHRYVFCALTVSSVQVLRAVTFGRWIKFHNEAVVLSVRSDRPKCAARRAACETIRSDMRGRGPPKHQKTSKERDRKMVYAPLPMVYGCQRPAYEGDGQRDGQLLVCCQRKLGRGTFTASSEPGLLIWMSVLTHAGTTATKNKSTLQVLVLRCPRRMRNLLSHPLPTSSLPDGKLEIDRKTRKRQAETTTYRSSGFPVLEYTREPTYTRKKFGIESQAGEGEWSAGNRTT